jgi:glycine/D-amino acid oxidase-like deaminating enzyme
MREHVGDTGNRSLWADQVAGRTIPSTAAQRDRAEGDLDVDVAIVGAGYTGLWTAYSLLGLDPSLRIIVLDAHQVGFGASGRNGGWCVGELAGGLHGAIRLASRRGDDTANARRRGISMTTAIMDAVDDVGRVVSDEGIDCGFARGGVVRLARTGPQLARQREEVDDYAAHGFGDDHLRLLDPAEARQMLSATDVVGGLHFARAARVQPAELVHGLAAAVERRGGRIAEDSRVIAIVEGPSPVAVTSAARVRADVVVRATEGYTRDLAGERRTLLPFYSLMVATEPLSAALWDEIGLTDRQTFCDDRRMVIYGQRTTDDRIAFGGRGAPYTFGSVIDSDAETKRSAHDAIAATLVDLLPQLGGVEITHRWGGVLGIPRDWHPSVGFDRSIGVAWAGGYVGEGVAAANLAGRTLADLVTGRESDLVDHPWVGHRSRRWEPEPLRWCGVNSMLRLTDWSDRREARIGKPSMFVRLSDRLRR